MVDRAHLAAERAPLCAALAGGEGGHAADHALATRCRLQSQSMPLQAPGPLPMWRRSGLRPRRQGIREEPITRKRKSVVKGKSVSVRVDLGGRRPTKKKK